MTIRDCHGVDELSRRHTGIVSTEEKVHGFILSYSAVVFEVLRERVFFPSIPWEYSLLVRFGRHIPYCIFITQHRCGISLHRSSVWPCPEICLRPIRHTLLLMSVRDVALFLLLLFNAILTAINITSGNFTSNLLAPLPIEGGGALHLELVHVKVAPACATCAWQWGMT